MIRWLKFLFTTTRAVAAVFLLAFCYAIALIVMYFPRSPREEREDEELDPLDDPEPPCAPDDAGVGRSHQGRSAA